MRAETGVGPSIASGSQTYSGICADFPVAPRNSSSVMPVSAPNVASGGSADTRTAICWKSRVPKILNSQNIPSTNPKSPIRLTTNAFLPASAAEGLVNQNPISRYEQRPTPSQPMNMTGKFAPSTSTSMNAANRFKYEKYRAYSPSVSSCM